MRRRVAVLLGTHDFSAFRAANARPRIAGEDRAGDRHRARQGDSAHRRSSANAFLQHMVRNIVGALVARRRRQGTRRVGRASCCGRAIATRAGDVCAGRALFDGRRVRSALALPPHVRRAGAHRVTSHAVTNAQVLRSAASRAREDAHGGRRAPAPMRSASCSGPATPRARRSRRARGRSSRRAAAVRHVGRALRRPRAAGSARGARRACRSALLQFHGSETPEFCRASGGRTSRRSRVSAGDVDLLESAGGL